MKKFIKAKASNIIVVFMTPRDRVLGALRGEDVGGVVATSVTQVGTVEAMEKIGAFWPAAHKDPEQMVKLGASLFHLAGLETLRIPFCLSVIAEAFGCSIDMGTIERQPSVMGPSPTIPEEIPENFLNIGRIPVVLKAAKLMNQYYQELPKIVGMEGPFTLAGHIVGVENVMRWLLKKQEALSKVIDLCTKANIEYIKALLDAGAEVITICEPTASPELIRPADFVTFVKPKLKEIALTIDNKGGVSVLHICGRTQKILKDMADTGFHALSIEEKVDIREAKSIVGNRARIVGNISPVKVLLSGTPEEVRAECKKTIEAGVDVLAPGCGLAPRTPLENIKAFANSIK